ncbi:adenosylmethionine decarboxylase [Mycotypha africana]|uniref:adenosylmethionine decarboxylase n=1 Tax=Mycotypha africana TaxID=64632 RepID=UPI0023006575|nr:adenosylmethionine decarboxylase [Mycotypha africana]KAI8984677.1 adenosylmethionine decarboxylase [Mycotypha africana]
MTQINIPHPSAPPPSGANYSAEHGCFEGPEKLLEIWFSPAPFARPVSSHAQATTARCTSNSDSEFSDESNPVTPNDSMINLSLGFSNDLRTVEKPIWDSMLATVKCTILNIVKNQHVHAYLLSESSMFVFPHKIILKTCGTTTLLKAIPLILDIAWNHCGYKSIYRLFYSRKSFMFPDKQPDPHRSWEEEVNYLDGYFSNGASYVIGNTRAEEWYLYLTSPGQTRYEIMAVDDAKRLVKETEGLSWLSNDGYAANSWSKFNPSNKKLLNSNKSFYNAYAPKEKMTTIHGYRTYDETIEILMPNLNPEAMRPFYHRSNEPAGLEGGKRVDFETGLDQLYPQADIDSYLFEPCGYSCNGLVEDGYYTIHVTPEPQCSYASFETTIPVKPMDTPENNSQEREDAILKLVRQVLDIFQPGSFTITYFTSHIDEEQQRTNMNKLVHIVDKYGGYKRNDKILYDFEGYDFIFGHYTKI